MFFTRRKHAPALAPERIRGLRISLNTPVLRAEALPVAPARAVLVLYEYEDGRPTVGLAVRSLKTGGVIHYEPEADLPPDADGLDAVMAFGEGMGFLFDDDELEQGDAERAFAMWNDLMGAPAELDVALTSLEPDDGIEELLLVEEVSGPGAGFELSPDLETAAPPDTHLLTTMVEDALATRPDAPLEALLPPLTKFRDLEPLGAFEPSGMEPGEPAEPVPGEAAGLPTQDAAPAAPGVEADLPAAAPPAGGEAKPTGSSRKRRRAALGRLRLVKQRKAGSDEERRRFLARILSAFDGHRAADGAAQAEGSLGTLQLLRRKSEIRSGPPARRWR